MMKPLLSILIPITPDRTETVKPLLKMFDVCGYGAKHGGVYFNYLPLFIEKYSYPESSIEVILASDEKMMTIGEKREYLYQMASGLYSWQIDSDDLISEDAIELILKAIEQEPDCITFEESVTIDGKSYTSNHSLKYDKWEDNYDGYDFTRSVFYKNVIKTEIARAVPFKHIRWNEDEQFSMDLMPYLKSEVHIPKQIYIYQYTSTPFNERYGITD